MFHIRIKYLFLIAFFLSACKTSPTPAPQEPVGPEPTTNPIMVLPSDPPQTVPSPAQPSPPPTPEPPAVVPCVIPNPPLIERTPDAILLLQPIVFDFNKAKIRPESFPILNQIGYLLNCDLSLRISIEAHRSADPYNGVRAVEITTRRANAVRDYLLHLGIDAIRIESVGFGESRPIAPNDTPENQAKNRRIEIRIIKKAL